MKITSTTLSIPPYLSTSWDQVTAIKTEPFNESLVLVVTLQDGSKKEIPNLDGKTIEQIFEAHSQYLESTSEISGITPLNFSFQKEGDQAMSLGDSLQHNPDQSKLPDLPRPILQKITEIAKVFGLEDISLLPNPEPECNCVHCQLLRVMKEESEPAEENVTDEDLHFEDWKITQLNDKLYEVTNPLDQNEHYQVFLGSPLGCTCGNIRCEHIQAVLKT